MSIPHSGRGGRRFKSCHSDQFFGSSPSDPAPIAAPFAESSRSSSRCRLIFIHIQIASRAPATPTNYIKDLLVAAYVRKCLRDKLRDRNRRPHAFRSGVNWEQTRPLPCQGWGRWLESLRLLKDLAGIWRIRKWARVTLG